MLKKFGLGYFLSHVATASRMQMPPYVTRAPYRTLRRLCIAILSVLIGFHVIHPNTSLSSVNEHCQ